MDELGTTLAIMVVVKAKNPRKIQYNEAFGSALKAAIDADSRHVDVIAADAGVVPATLRDWVSGRHAPSLYDASRLVDTLGVPVANLVPRGRS